MIAISVTAEVRCIVALFIYSCNIYLFHKLRKEIFQEVRVRGEDGKIGESNALPGLIMPTFALSNSSISGVRYLACVLPECDRQCRSFSPERSETP
jgi:hypothetical protein